MPSSCSTKVTGRNKETAGLKGPPMHAERVKCIRRVVGEPESVASRMILVLKAHREIDAQCRSQAEAAGLEVDNLTVADIAYPLVKKRVICIFQQQLVHVRNGCISDDPDHLPYVKVGTINFHSTGHHLPVSAWHQQSRSCPFCARPNLLLFLARHRCGGL